MYVTIQLAQLAQISKFQESTYDTEKYWPHFQLFFIVPRIISLGPAAPQE